VNNPVYVSNMIVYHGNLPPTIHSIPVLLKNGYKLNDQYLTFTDSTLFNYFISNGQYDNKWTVKIINSQ
jgi:hypothetical protein